MSQVSDDARLAAVVEMTKILIDKAVRKNESLTLKQATDHASAVVQDIINHNATTFRQRGH